MIISTVTALHTPTAIQTGVLLDPSDTTGATPAEMSVTDICCAVGSGILILSDAAACWMAVARVAGVMAAAWVIAIAASAAATTALKVTVIERRETEELMVAPGLTVVPLGLHKLRSHA